MSTALIEKTFLILETLAACDQPVPLKLLVERTGLPKSTLHRLLHSLMSLGYVDQDAKSSNYYVTMQLAQLGRSNRYEALKEVALPLMQQLHERFDETVNLGVLEGSYVYYLHVLKTTKTLGWMVSPGTRDSFYCTALGKVIAAFLSPEKRTHLVRSTRFTARTENTIVSKRRLQEVLDDIRISGFAVDNEENDLGVVCFAIPLLQDGFPIAAISVSLPKVRLSNELRERIINGLQEIRQRSQRLPVSAS
jgi:DNA-binding IclR family transcriptional regulator